MIAEEVKQVLDAARSRKGRTILELCSKYPAGRHWLRLKRKNGEIVMSGEVWQSKSALRKFAAELLQDIADCQYKEVESQTEPKKEDNA